MLRDCQHSSDIWRGIKWTLVRSEGKSTTKERLSENLNVSRVRLNQSMSRARERFRKIPGSTEGRSCAGLAVSLRPSASVPSNSAHPHLDGRHSLHPSRSRAERAGLRGLWPAQPPPSAALYSLRGELCCGGKSSPAS